MSDPFSNWIGSPTFFSPTDVPPDHVNMHAPPNFYSAFNLNPVTAVESLLRNQNNSFLENSFSLGPFLFYCNGLTPTAITTFFVSQPNNMRSHYFFFFSSLQLDYVNFVDAMRILLPKVAFSENPVHVQAIVKSFAAAYYTFNQYIPETREDLEIMTYAAILFSMSIRQNYIMPLDEFLKLTKNAQSSNETKRSFYESIKAKPIPIIFTFGAFQTEPNDHKTGSLKKLAGVFRKKSKKFYIINKNELQSYKDQQLKEAAGGIEILNTQTTFVPPNGKDPGHLVIKRFDGKEFGYSFKKNGKKMRKNTDYQFYGTSDEDTKQWCELLNFNSLYITLTQLTGSN